MQIASDYKDLLRILNKHKVKYLIIGAYAVIYYTEPRYTKDFDIWVESKIENAKKIYSALKEFGAPLKDVKLEDFVKKDMVFQIGVEPIRVDIIMGIGDIKFEVVWGNRTRTFIDDIKVNIIGMKELLKSKAMANRPADLIDIENLKLKLRFKRRS